MTNKKTYTGILKMIKSITFYNFLFVLTFFAIIFSIFYNCRNNEENTAYCESIGYKYSPGERACYKENDEYNDKSQRYMYKKIPDSLSDVS